MSADPGPTTVSFTAMADGTAAEFQLVGRTPTGYA